MSSQIIRKEVDRIPFRSDLLYAFYGLKHQLRTKAIIYNTIFSGFTSDAIKAVRLSRITGQSLTKQESQVLSQAFLIALVGGHVIALGVHVVLSIDVTTHVYAHPLQSYVSQKEYLVWASTFLIVTRIIEIIGLVMRQAWGWFLTQYTYLSALPLLWFSSIVTPEAHVLLDTLVYSMIIVLLYTNPVRRMYFSKKIPFLRFITVMGVLNTVFFVVVEVGKTMV